MTEAETLVLARRAGIDTDYVTVSEDRTIIRYYGTITFEALSALSAAFKTTRIDLGIEEGCASDPSTDPYITIWTK